MGSMNYELTVPAHPTFVADTFRECPNDCPQRVALREDGHRVMARIAGFLCNQHRIMIGREVCTIEDDHDSRKTNKEAEGDQDA